MSSDHDLVSSYVREGSDSAFRALVARHVNLVFATANRQVGDAGMAEEITQNVFVALARKAPRLGGVETLAGWLHRTAILESKARIRAELRRRRREDAAAELASLDRQGASPLASLLPLLDEALLSLRDGDRLALVLRFLEDRSLREVGVELGVAEEAARKRISRALDRVGEFFRQRGFVVATVGGASTLMAQAVQAAPTGLVASATQAGLAATGAATSLQLSLFQLMNLTKTQTVAACLALAAVPLAIQWQTHTALARQHVEAIHQLTQASQRLAGLDAGIQRSQRELAELRLDTANAEIRRDELKAQRAGQLPMPAYQWDDNSAVVRVPKRILQKLEINAVDRNGQLSVQITEALQLTEPEARATQGTLNRFLAGYHALQAARIQPVIPTDQELNDHAPEETRVFEVPDLSAEIQPLRQTLFAELETALGQDRFQIFRRNLRYWMPIDEEEHGLSLSQAVVTFPHRFCFHPSPPGVPWLGYGLSKRNGASLSGSMRIDMTIDDIPAFLRPALQDWINQALSQPPVK